MQTVLPIIDAVGEPYWNCEVGIVRLSAQIDSALLLSIKLGHFNNVALTNEFRTVEDIDVIMINVFSTEQRKTFNNFFWIMICNLVQSAFYLFAFVCHFCVVKKENCP